MTETSKITDRPFTREFPPALTNVSMPSTPKEPAEVSKAIENLVAHTYLSDAELPYHGQSHPRTVLKHAGILIERAQKFGIKVDEVALERAILLHDALGHLNPKLFNFDSPEELAAHFSYNFLISQGIEEDEARKVERLILATNPLFEPTNTEEIIIRAADLWGLGASYEECKSGSLALHREAELMSGTQIERAEYVRKQFKFLRLFVWRMLELTPEARTELGASNWHTKLISNLAKMANEMLIKEGEILTVTAELYSSNRAVRIPGDNSNLMYVALANDTNDRESILAQLQNDSKIEAVNFVIPGAEAGLSLPDEFCDELRLDTLSLKAIMEASRVLKNGGTLYLNLDELEVYECLKPALKQYGFEVTNEKDKQLIQLKKKFNR